MKEIELINKIKAICDEAERGMWQYDEHDAAGFFYDVCDLMKEYEKESCHDA